MTFNVKRDRFYTKIILITLLIVAAATLWPVVYEVFYSPVIDWIAVSIMCVLFIATSGFILWTWLDIEYSFREDYLFVRGGPFRSRIPYNKITRLNETSNVLVGYRILSSRDALEVYYISGLLGSIIISPQDKEMFMEELRKRCPLI